MATLKRRSAAVVLLVHTADDSREMYADVIVTELRIPGALEGYDFIQQLRLDEQTRNKPVIVVTSWAWQTERVRAEEAGCDLFLTKPCFPEALLRHVRQALRIGKPRQVRQRPVRKRGQ